MAMSSEVDILICGYSDERFTREIQLAFRHWQIYQCAAPHAIYGRKFRNAYYTDGVLAHKNGEGILEYLRSNTEGEVTHFDFYETPTAPDPQDYKDAELLRTIRRSRYT